MLEQMYLRPGGRVTQVFTTRKESEAVYRILSSKHTDVAKLREAMRDACVGRIGDRCFVLAIQDTTALNFTAHPATCGLGPLGHSQLLGFLHHSVMLVGDDGVPLGLVYQDTWARKADEPPQEPDTRKRPLADKESARWVESQQAIHEAIPTGVGVLTVADREADIIDLLWLPRPDNCDLLIRACYDRVVEGPRRLLRATVEAAPLAGTYEIQLPRRPERKPRDAHLNIRYCPVTVEPPSHRKSDPEAKSVKLTAIWTYETNPPEGESPVDWLLLTTLPITDFEAARECVRYYTLRWMIERLHYTLKSCCRFEDSQLRTFERLERWLVLQSIIAWRLLWMTYIARVDDEQSCEIAFTPLEWHLLWRSHHPDQPLPARGPSLKEAMHWMADLGGFAPNKGHPGVRRLTRGMQCLQQMVLGVQLLTPLKM